MKLRWSIVRESERLFGRGLRLVLYYGLSCTIFMKMPCSFAL